MKYETTILNNNGSWYVRLPPVFAKHMGLKEEDQTPVEAEIQDEKGKHGNYCSIWKKGA
jgi:hypothetical protein